jgi:hypothetical protein
MLTQIVHDFPLRFYHLHFSRLAAHDNNYHRRISIRFSPPGAYHQRNKSAKRPPASKPTETNFANPTFKGMHKTASASSFPGYEEDPADAIGANGNDSYIITVGETDTGTKKSVESDFD